MEDFRKEFEKRGLDFDELSPATPEFMIKGRRKVKEKDEELKKARRENERRKLKEKDEELKKVRREKENERREKERRKVKEPDEESTKADVKIGRCGQGWELLQ